MCHHAKVATILLSVHTCLIESVSIAHTHMHTHIAHTHMCTHITHTHHTTTGDMVRRSALTCNDVQDCFSPLNYYSITEHPKTSRAITEKPNIQKNQTSHVQHSHHNKNA